MEFLNYRLFADLEVVGQLIENHRTLHSDDSLLRSGCLITSLFVFEELKCRLRQAVTALRSVCDGLESLFFELIELGKVLSDGRILQGLKLHQLVQVYPLFDQDFLMCDQKSSLQSESLISLHFVRRGQHLALEVPYLHLLVEFLRVESLVDLEVLKCVEVEVARQTSMLGLLLVKFPKVSHHRETYEAELYVCVVLFYQTIAVMNHIESLFKHEVIEVSREYDPVCLHHLIERDKKVRLVNHQKGAHVVSLLAV